MRTFNKEILRSIRGSLGRFAAIAAIVALGAGFYAGLRMTCPDMNLSADRYYDGMELMDIRVVSTMGMTDEDMDALSDIEGVEAVMPAYETDVMATINDEQYAIRVHSLPESALDSVQASDVVVESDDESYLNRLVLTDGRLPENECECVISSDRVMNSPTEIGDTITVTECSSGIDDTLVTRTYTIVGYVHSPYYVSSTSMGTTSLGSGTIQQFMYVLESSFAPDYPYTEAFVTVEGADELNSSSDAYGDLVAEVMARIEAIASAREDARLEQLRADAQSELDEARADYQSERDDALSQLDDALSELEEAAAALKQSAAEIASGQKDYEEGVAELEASRSQAEASFSAAEEEISVGQAEVDAGWDELSAAAAELEAAWASAGIGADEADAACAQIDAGIEEAESGIAQLEEGIAQLEEALTQLEEGIAQLEVAGAADTDQYAQYVAQLASIQGQLATAQEQLSSVQGQVALLESQRAALVQLMDAQDDYDEAYDAAAARLVEAQDELDAARDELDKARAGAAEQFANAEAELAEAAEALASGRSQLAEGQAEYEQGMADYEDAKAEAEDGFADAEAELADAQAEIEGIEQPEWMVMDRSKNYGAASFASDAQRVDSIASIFPFIFFLVAALVALTTMTRMVEEERVLIGTYKALGYSKARITSKYLIYAAVASAIGCVVGIAVLSYVLPWVIMEAYSIVYFVPRGPLPINVALALLSAGLSIGITLVSTWAAAASTLRESPAMLMRPRTPKAGKRILIERIGPMWHRLSFSWKVTCRNMFRYKRRLVMTLIGIAGCTGLLLTGLGLQDAINDIIDKHFGELVRYNVVVTGEEGMSQDARDELAAIMEDVDVVSECALTQSTSLVAVDSTSSAPSVTLVVPQDADMFQQLWIMRERVGHAALALDDSGAIITEKLSDELDVSVGDTVVLAVQDDMGNATDETYELVVAGIMENYLYNYAFVTPGYYETVFDEEPDYTTAYALMSTDEGSRAAFNEEARAIDGVKTVAYNDETIDTYRTMLRSVNMVVVVLVVAAAALAFIVLYNLTNINITERVREIATLKVLGFTPHEVSVYIYREVMLLSIIGCLIGLVFGIYLEGFVVVTAEVDQVMFGRTIHAPSYVLAFVLTIAFTVFVMFAMRKKLSRVDMIESLKSNE